jgi:hypothetical protein
LSEPVTVKVRVRCYGGAYIARCNGKTASSTNQPRFAVLNVARKAAEVLQSLGAIGEIPDEDKITATDHGGGLWEATF